MIRSTLITNPCRKL